MSADFLLELERIIDTRIDSGDASSYTHRLIHEGPIKIAQKVGEEGVETALAAVAGDDAQLLDEAADLLFHLLVLLRSKRLSLTDVDRVLAERHRAT